MYSDKIVVAVKVNGKVLREQGDQVSLPFSSEFSILVKNLNSVRVQVAVAIDGTNATDGTRLIIQPNSSMEIERFIRNGNLNSGNKFKFIERTAEVEEHRGIGTDDGIIRVEAWREQVFNQPTVIYSHYYPYYYPPNTLPYWWYSGGGIVESSLSGASFSQGQTTGSANRMAAMKSAPLEQERSGITVPGDISNQQFVSTYGFPLEPTSTVVVLRLRGSVAGKPVVTPVTVGVKPTCVTCGKTNKATNEFCSQCGTSLCLV